MFDGRPDEFHKVLSRSSLSALLSYNGAHANRLAHQEFKAKQSHRLKKKFCAAR